MVRRVGLLGSLFLAACQIHVADDGALYDQDRAPSVATPTPEPSGNSLSCRTAIDPAKELIVTQRSVLLDRRAQSVANGSWSFRARMADLAGSDAAAAAFTAQWIDQWRTVTAVGPAYAPVTPRPGAGEKLGDPWSLELLAIVNRADLRASDDGCTGGGGELRFVYGASVAFTVIVEIPWPTTRTARGWTEAWHALVDVPFGDAYNAQLAALTDEIVRSSPRAAWRVRTNETAFGSTWEMRDFALDPATGSLVQTPIATTPRIELDGSTSLDEWADENRADIATGAFALPSSFQAGAAPIRQSSFRWRSQTLSESDRASFSSATCNGCHGGEHSRGGLTFQHIAPSNAPTYYARTGDRGETQLSRWLTDEELPRREASVRAALCARACEPAAPRPDPSSYGRSP